MTEGELAGWHHRLDGRESGAKDSALLSSRDAGLLEPPERPQGRRCCAPQVLRR